MKYPCELIEDLLPLYVDEVCSEESRKVIEEHLSECSKCKAVYSSMSDLDTTEMIPSLAAQELKKAESFHSVKKKLFRKQLLITIGVVLAVIILAFATVSILKKSQQVVEYNDNISVSMVDGDLIGRLNGSQESYLRIKRISAVVSGEEKDILLFYVSDTKWDRLVYGDNIFSEFTLCEADKGSADISTVYYFTGDYNDLDNLDEKEFEKVIINSQLLWEK